MPDSQKPEMLLRPERVAGDYPLVCNLKSLRFYHKMTQDELAEKAGLTRQAIIELELGRAAPKLVTALKLADLLGVGVMDLYMKTGTWTPPPRRSLAPLPKQRRAFGVSQPRVLR